MKSFTVTVFYEVFYFVSQKSRNFVTQTYDVLPGKHCHVKVWQLTRISFYAEHIKETKKPWLCFLLVQLGFHQKVLPDKLIVICILELCSNTSVPCFSLGQDCDILNVTENSICCKTPPKPEVLRTVYPGKLPEERMAISTFT